MYIKNKTKFKKWLETKLKIDNTVIHYQRRDMKDYEKNVFNSGLLFNYSIKIDSISGGKAKITIS